MPTDHLGVLSSADRARLRPEPAPSWIDPMLATATDNRFSDPSWLFERKLDGIRCLTFRHRGEPRLLSRRRQRLGDTFPELVDLLASQQCDDFVVDGEIVAFEHGRTSFARLQLRSGIHDPVRARRSPVAVVYYLFDVLHLDGYDTRSVPLRSRKRLLRRTFDFGGPIRFTQHFNERGEVLFAKACSEGWEGLIAKRADSVYSSRRSTDWLKLKCSAGQEFVIAGFTEPSGSRYGFGALLLGYYDGGALVYAGKVGTGFDERLLRDLRARMDGLEIESSPFSRPVRLERSVRFVRPELVAEVAFTEWTRDGMLRHPRFKGLRRDKSAKEVQRERPRRAP
jgi:bifunctional non-homologous end joining protein LigD